MVMKWALGRTKSVGSCYRCDYVKVTEVKITRYTSWYKNVYTISLPASAHYTPVIKRGKNDYNLNLHFCTLCINFHIYRYNRTNISISWQISPFHDRYFQFITDISISWQISPFHDRYLHFITDISISWQISPFHDRCCNLPILNMCPWIFLINSINGEYPFFNSLNNISPLISIWFLVQLFVTYV